MSLIDRIARSLAADPPHDLLIGDLVEGHDPPGLWSDGLFFKLVP